MSPKAETITGGCLCGAIRYEARVPLIDVHYCHCRTCQKSFGTLFAVFGSVPREALEFTSGSPKLYCSSPYADCGFCAACGTPLTFRYLKSNWIAVSIGSLDRPDAVRPEIHWGIESRVPWLTIQDGLPRRPIEGDPEYMVTRE